MYDELVREGRESHGRKSGQSQLCMADFGDRSLGKEFGKAGLSWAATSGQQAAGSAHCSR